MRREAFVQSAQHLAQSVHTYRLGGSGADGTCDCIGLVIGAMRGIGEKWKGTHGSNWAARYAVTGLRPVGEGDRLKHGDLVFKVRSSGETGYSLPDRYASSGDRRDYYHVGIVMSASPLRILHCTSPGPIAWDEKIGRWKMTGTLLGMEDGSEMEEKKSVMEKATVVTTNGLGVNLRERASVSSRRVDKLPEGAQVEILSRDGEWAQVHCEGREGFVRTEFLAISEAQEDMVALPRSACLAIYEACANALGLGVG